jgi:hypothetical protein
MVTPPLFSFDLLALPSFRIESAAFQLILPAELNFGRACPGPACP